MTLTFSLLPIPYYIPGRSYNHQLLIYGVNVLSIVYGLDRCLVAEIIPGRSFPASAAGETIHEGGIKQPGSW